MASAVDWFLALCSQCASNYGWDTVKPTFRVDATTWSIENVQVRKTARGGPAEWESILNPTDGSAESVGSPTYFCDHNHRFHRMDRIGLVQWIVNQVIAARGTGSEVAFLKPSGSRPGEERALARQIGPVTVIPFSQKASGP